VTVGFPTSRRAVIVGAGPSGFYAADRLLGAGFEVDLLDALPTPFGLVRAGVAPDHPKIKAVTRVDEKTAASRASASSAASSSARTSRAGSCWSATT
jgi:cation diffusion facilitator CzcD-associated flavoprotein CzcO